ncbi:MAG: DNA polymerase I, partial [Deltaproteobacteria bacterium]|nr:DNA polymerase I [Deltaproteobacteria bacterium]
TQMLKKVLKDFCPSHLAVVFDTKAPSFRHKLYEQYKAQRPEMPDALKPQLPYIKEIVNAFNIPCLEMDGYEADDVIGTLAQRAKTQAYHVTIITGDKDMLQLVCEGVTVVDTMKDKTYRTDEVIERFGVEPERVTDVMALAGDASDNVPGVHGIGEKGASKLIKEFGTIENLLSNLDKVKNKKIQGALKSHAEMAKLSKELVTIKRDAPVEINYDALTPSEPDKEKLKILFQELGFTRLLNELSPQTTVDTRLPVQIILKHDELNCLADGLKSSDSFAIVCKSHQGELAGIAIALKSGSAFYIPIKHYYLGAPEQLNINDVLNLLKPIFENESIKKFTQDAKMLYLAMSKNNISVKGIDFDLTIASYLLNIQPLKPTSCLKPDMDIETLAQYACEETVLINKLKDEHLPLLNEQGLLNLFKDIELPFAEVLASMEFAGIRVDRPYLEAYGRELDYLLADIKKKIYTTSGFEFNINSPKQLADVLFERLKLKPVKKTKTGYSTDEEVLTRLALSHELPQEILNYRQIAKLKSTYIDGILSLLNPETGRVHTSFNAASTATGRLSSSEPNLQNIPIKTERGRLIRKAFIPDEGFIFISFDYSQIELRLVAHLSGDRHLVEAFRNDGDIHARTASEIFGAEPCMVTDEMRRKAKAINFGIIYGMGEYGLSSELGISREEAGEYITRYFSIYSGVRGYIDSVIKEAGEKGYVATILGRRRYIPELKSEIESVRKFGERIAINTPVQGSAADLIKLAMLKIYKRFRAEGLRTRMLLQIHDELLFEISDDEIKQSNDIIKYEMENAVKLSVPVKVNIGVGKNWMEAG